MFRTVYNTKLNCWVIQFLCLGLFWRTVRAWPSRDVLTFDTLEQVETYVTDRGIDQLYRLYIGHQAPVLVAEEAAPQIEEAKQ